MNVEMSLTLRLLMLGKEVGGIIGKKGDHIKRFREDSGAKINISDGSCPERIVTISGFVPDVYRAFTMICKKFEECSAGAPGSYAKYMKSLNNATESGNNANNNVSINNNNLLSDSTSPDKQSLLGISSNNSSSLLNEDIGDNFAKKDSDVLTINNNNTTTVNNNLNSMNTKEEAILSSSTNNNAPSVTMRLIVPASQCGSLIGRGGVKIKELRDITGATIQVATDVLPNSTERVVTIIGNVDSLTRCAYHICNIMVECPPKGFTIPYLPKPTTTLNPLLYAAMAASQASAYNLPSQYALAAAHPDINRLFAGAASSSLSNAFNPALVANTLRNNNTESTGGNLSSLSRVTSSHEMVIPNGLIGCVIGKGGAKINEIRQISGATIKISNSEGNDKDRTVTINGTPEAINLAQYLITITII